MESLDNGPGLLPFRLGPTNIVSNYHSFLQVIDLKDLQTKLNSISSQLDGIGPELNNKTSSLFEPHINYLKNKLVVLSEQLQTFESNRVKRGLVDGLGSVVKSITGNLDYTDAVHYNNAIKSLQDKENQVITEFNSHVSLTKEWSSQYSKIINNIADNQNRIIYLLDKIRQSIATNDNDLIKYAHLAQVFLILSDNIDSVSLEIVKLQNVLAFVRTSTMHHAIISPASIRNITMKLHDLYGKDRIIDLDIREYYDIIKLGSYYVENSIVIVYKFPIILPQSYNLYKLSIIPNKNHEILSPFSPFIAIHLKDYKYIEAECPKTSKGYLCKETRNLQSKMTQDCVYQLITTQQRTAACRPITVTLQNAAFEKLDDRHYTVSLPNPTKVHLSCSQDLHQTLQGSYLIMIPQGCLLETSEFVISNLKDRLRGQAVKIMDLPKETKSNTSLVPSFKFNSIDLSYLHETNSKIQLQKEVEPLRNIDYYSLYHTTIPMYLILSSACVLAIVVAARRYYMNGMKIKTDTTQETSIELQGIYAIPKRDSKSSRSSDNQPPAQFTTNVFNSRCSTGGGVTQA